jgi:pimeloyl-ACP methyl ester carboxylesterase
MEPRIQYAKTSDGVSIAYWTMGEGETQLVMPGSPIVPARLNLDDAMGMPWYERLSRGMRVIGFDHRGVGLSDREPVDFSLEAQA